MRWAAGGQLSSQGLGNRGRNCLSLCNEVKPWPVLSRFQREESRLAQWPQSTECAEVLPVWLAESSALDSELQGAWQGGQRQGGPGARWGVVLSVALDLGRTSASPVVVWPRPQTETHPWRSWWASPPIPTTGLEKWPPVWRQGSLAQLYPKLLAPLPEPADPRAALGHRLCRLAEKRPLCLDSFIQACFR